MVKTLSPNAFRTLTAFADALAVPVAVFVSLYLHAPGSAWLSFLQTNVSILPALMLAVATVSICLPSLAGTYFSLTGNSTGRHLILSCFVTVLNALGLAVFGSHAPFGVYAVFAMAYFIQCNLSHVVLNALKPVKNPVQVDALDGASKENEWSADATPHLLGRNGVAPRMEGARSYADRVVFISGAGGSIGSELSRQVLACRPRKIILFELSEPALYQVHQSIDRAAVGTNIEVVPVLGSITDERKVQKTLCDYSVQVVLHAAAYKHVPLVELNPLEGLRNNVVGTQVLVSQSVAAGVERFVLISSDKAVRPINVMGASKRFCELVVQDVSRRFAGQSLPVFSIVRFGNVLGSSGSVLPLFRDQVRRGGPVTVTHPDVSRFFMTVQEAVHLVLHAGSIARGGEVFVLDMGKPVKIETLARRVVQGAGLSVRDEENPTGDIELKFIGLRRGEKLREELTLTSKRAATSHSRICRAIEAGLSEFEVAAALRAMRRALANEDEDDARANACKWVAGTGDVLESVARASKTKRDSGCAVSLSNRTKRSTSIGAGCP